MAALNAEIKRYNNRPCIHLNGHICMQLQIHREHDGLGGNAMARGIQEACALRNKMWFTEMDQATNLIDISEIKNNSVWDSDVVHNFVEKTVPRDVSIIERNVMNITTKGSGFWYFDFGPMFKSGWWDYPDYMDAVKRLKDLSDASFVKEQKSEAEVLTVFDTSSYYYTIIWYCIPIHRVRKRLSQEPA